MDWIRGHVSALCKLVRKDAIPLTDSFGFSDFIVNSPFGRYDGNVYETYFKQVQLAHKPAQVPPYFKSEIAPLLSRKMDTEGHLELEDED